MRTTEVIDLGSAAGGATSSVLAFALLVVFIIPQWAVVLWMVRSPHRLHSLSRSTRRRLLATTCFITAVALGSIGPLWVNNELIAPERPELRRVVIVGTIVQSVVLGLLMILAASRRAAASGAPERTVRRKPSPRAISIVLFAWVVAAGVVVALALGPLSGRPAEKHAWRALALALAVIATLTVTAREGHP
jgi:hypothetical protein